MYVYDSKGVGVDIKIITMSVCVCVIVQQLMSMVFSWTHLLM